MPHWSRAVSCTITEAVDHEVEARTLKSASILRKYKRSCNHACVPHGDQKPKRRSSAGGCGRPNSAARPGHGRRL